MRRQVGWFTDGKPGYLVPFQQIRIQFVGLARCLFLSPILFYTHMTIQNLDSKHAFRWMGFFWLSCFLLQCLSLSLYNLDYYLRHESKRRQTQWSDLKLSLDPLNRSQFNVPTLLINKFELDLIWWILITV